MHVQNPSQNPLTCPSLKEVKEHKGFPAYIKVLRLIRGFGSVFPLNPPLSPEEKRERAAGYRPIMGWIGQGPVF